MYINTDKSALICDMAETYGVYDIWSLPPSTAAALAAGLHEDSRIKMKISGRKIGTDRALAAIIADRLGTLIWFKTEDGQKGRNRPESLYDMLTKDPDDSEQLASYTELEFEEARQRILDQILKNEEGKNDG